MKRRIDDILGTVNVGLDTFERIVFRRRHLLQRSRMNDNINTAHCHFQTALVADITDEIAHCRKLRFRKFLLHFRLLQFIPAEDHKPFRLVVVEDTFDEGTTERTGPASDKNMLIVEHRLPSADYQKDVVNVRQA